jgi:hypothetical protein
MVCQSGIWFFQLVNRFTAPPLLSSNREQDIDKDKLLKKNGIQEVVGSIPISSTIL